MARGRWSRAWRGLAAAVAGVVVTVAGIVLVDRPCAPGVRDCLGPAVGAFVISLALGLLVLVGLCMWLRLGLLVALVVLVGWLGLALVLALLDAEPRGWPLFVLWPPLVAAALPQAPRRRTTSPASR